MGVKKTKELDGYHAKKEKKKEGAAGFFALLSPFLQATLGSPLTPPRRNTSTASTSFNDRCNYTVSPLTPLFKEPPLFL